MGDQNYLMIGLGVTIFVILANLLFMVAFPSFVAKLLGKEDNPEPKPENN